MAAKASSAAERRAALDRLDVSATAMKGGTTVRPARDSSAETSEAPEVPALAVTAVFVRFPAVRHAAALSRIAELR